jgi:hypothetical protein
MTDQTLAYLANWKPTSGPPHRGCGQTNMYLSHQEVHTINQMMINNVPLSKLEEWIKHYDMTYYPAHIVGPLAQACLLANQDYIALLLKYKCNVVEAKRDLQYEQLSPAQEACVNLLPSP